MRGDGPTAPAEPAFVQAEVWTPAPMSETRRPESRRTSLLLAVGRGLADFAGARAAAELARCEREMLLDWVAVGDRDAVELVQLGKADAALIAGSLSERDANAGLRQVVLGAEVFALVTAAGTSLTNLTRSQATDLLTGRVDHWSQVGLDAGPVSLVLPADAGQLERTQRGMLPGAKFTARCVRASTDEQVFDHVLRTPGAIGLVRLAAIDRAPEVQTLAIDGVAPSLAGFRAGLYPFGLAIGVVTSGRPGGNVARLTTFLAAPAQRQYLGDRLSWGP